MKTIRQLATEMGISRQALYKRVMKLPGETYVVAEDKTIYLTEEAERILVSDECDKYVKRKVKRFSMETEAETKESRSDGKKSETEDSEVSETVSEKGGKGETEGETVVSGNRKVSEYIDAFKCENEALSLKLSAATETNRLLSVSVDELRETCAFYRKQIEEKDEQIKSLLLQNASLTQSLSDAMESTKGAQALHANDIMRIEAAEAKEPEKKKRKLWIFGK